VLGERRAPGAARLGGGAADAGRQGGGRVLRKGKEGLQAVRATVTVDCTGDGDILPSRRRRRGGRYRHQRHPSMPSTPPSCSVASTWRAGLNSDRPAARVCGLMERGRSALRRSVRKRPCLLAQDVALFMGPRLAGYSAVDVEDLTEVEIRSRRLMGSTLRLPRACAGVRGGVSLCCRRRRSACGTPAGWSASGRSRGRTGRVASPVRTRSGSRPSLAPKTRFVSVPYGALVPVALDGFLVAGRAISCDATATRSCGEVPQCWLPVRPPARRRRWRWHSGFAHARWRSRGCSGLARQGALGVVAARGRNDAMSAGRGLGWRANCRCQP